MIEKRKRWNSGGVSDIIGNILVLGITVVLFSTIFVFVGQMPTPTNATYIDFSVSLEENSTTGFYNILNMTHVGGETLKDFDTSIYLTVDGNTHPLLFSDSLTPIGDTWSTGETALFDCSPGKIGGADIVNATRISIMVIADNELAWKGEVKSIGNSAPVIMDRWIDSDPNTTAREDVLVNDDFSVFVRIRDSDGDLDTSSVFVNMSSLGLGIVQMHPVSASAGDALITFIANSTTPASTPIGYYYFTINASDTAGHTSTARMEAAIGGDIGTSPNLVISEDNIWVTPSNPTRGDDGVRVYVKIVNYGKVSTTFTTHVYDTKPDGSSIELGTVSSTIPAGGPETIYVDWTSSELKPSGVHNISATAVLPLGVTDADPSDNTGGREIQVMPKILVVDDDGSSLGADTDTSSMILAALDSGDFSYDRFVVTETNGPAYDTGQNRMEDYDIIIWDSGHEDSGTLTATDETNLEKFMDAGGSLWLLGEDILDDVHTDAFIQNYIHVTGFSAGSGPDYMLNGTLGSCLNGTKNVTTTERNNVPNSGDIITTYSTDAGDEAGPALEGKSGINAIWYDDVDKHSRRVFFPFELASVEEPALQAEITYKVLWWLGNISYRQGRDLSVSEQSVTPTRPFYSQPVTVSAVIRNNGMTTEMNVDVAFWIDGQSEGTITNTTGIKPGESWRVNYTWVPKTVGTHSIIAEVDPYNVIEETNENNNRVSSYLASSEIYIQYRILVVDDDGSANNPGGSSGMANVTHNLTEALDSLDYDYETYTVPEGDNGPGNILEDYNAVLWVTGDEVSSTLTPRDRENLTDYLDNGGFLWLDGAGVINDLGTSDSFVRNYLKVGGGATDSGVPGNVYGKRGDAITHGMNIVADSGICSGADTLIPIGGGTEILWRDSSRTNAVALRYENTQADSKVVFMTVDLPGLNGTYVNNTFTNGSVTREAFTYMVMHWFGLPDQRVEVMAASSDIYISDAHPQLGESYVIRATIHNVGGKSTSALIRFMDGSTLIGSDSVYIAPDKTTTAEVVWTPLFAGHRTITIQIDPVYEIPNEVFRFNDNPFLRQYVYFFWDDMENGSSKWQHESTIMLLNGENALNYFDKSTTLYTDIIQDWDDSMSQYLEQTTEFYNSFDSSYLLRENSSTGTHVTTQKHYVPIDVVFALDTSGSMGDRPGGWGTPTKWDYTKQAAENFINNMKDHDRAAIWIFDGSGNPEKLIPDPTDPTLPPLMRIGGNRSEFINALESVSVNGGTPFYDTLGEAIENSLVYDSDASDNSRLEFVVGMTDGESNSDTEWSPHADWGDTTTSGGGSSGSGTYKGLLKAPPMVFTIGLLDNSSGGWGGGSDYHDDNYPTAPSWSHQTVPDQSSYEIEYDLWNCADSSLMPSGRYGRDFNQSSIGYSALSEFTDPDPNIGHYYFAENANQMDDIFKDIQEMTESIASGGGEEAPPGEVTRAYDGSAVTSAPEPPSVSTIVFDADFEDTSGDNAWTHGGDQDEWERGDAFHYHYHSASNCWGTDISGHTSWGSEYPDNYENNANEWLRSPSIDLTSATSATLTFWRLYQTESGYDHAYVNISDDGGANWHNLFTYDGSDTTWSQESTDISAYVGHHVLIEFRLVSDYSSTADGLYVDDVQIDANLGTPPSITLNTPSGGESWQVGTQHDITWTASAGSGSITSITLQYTYDGGTNWYDVDPQNTDTSTSGSYTWTIPDHVSTNCYVRATVSNSNGASSTDTSGKFSITEPNAPTITITSPSGGETWEQGSSYDITWTSNPGTGTISGVDLYYSDDNRASWNAIVHNTTDDGTYTWTVPTAAGPSTHCYIRAIIYDQYRHGQDDSGEFTIPEPPATVLKTFPKAGTVALPTQFVTVIFDKSMDTSKAPILTQTAGEDPGNWSSPIWSSTYQLHDTVSWTHDNWTMGDSVTVQVSNYYSASGPVGTPYSWSFDIIEFTSTSTSGGQSANHNKSAVTQTLDLSQAERATLSFWHKFNMRSGSNGGVLEVGYKDSAHAGSDGWAWKYITPSQGSYNGNLKLKDDSGNVISRPDSFGNEMVWCWNGISGKGEFSWQPVTVNLLNYVPAAYRGEVKVKFQYIQYGLGTGYGWYLDDVKVAISRADTTAVTSSSKDAWQLQDSAAHSGTHSWWNGNPSTGFCMAGIDNSLITMPINLVGARTATLSAYFRFNLNTQEGAPPDGFRVEVSSDNGITWQAINLGVRSGWGVSGSDNTGTTSYTGHNAGGNWTEAGTLTRLNCDLSEWSGNVILIRFRMVTTSASNYDHYEDSNAGFGGFYVDDVVVYGETIHG